MILVAGGTGFVGGAIVRELARRGRKVVVLTRDAGRARGRFSGLEIEYRQGDVHDAESLRTAMQGSEVVIGELRLTVGCQQSGLSPKANSLLKLPVHDQGVVEGLEAEEAVGILYPT